MSSSPPSRPPRFFRRFIYRRLIYRLFIFRGFTYRLFTFRLLTVSRRLRPGAPLDAAQD